MSTTEKAFLDRAMRLDAWRRLTIETANGPRYLTPHEICILQEIFEDAREKWIKGGPVEELGIELGLLEEDRPE